MFHSLGGVKSVLQWVTNCPFEVSISSIQGGYVHIKIRVPDEVDPDVWDKRVLNHTEEGDEDEMV